MAKVGVWIVGARGGLATTLIVGTLALARRLTSTSGLITCLDEFASLGYAAFDDLVFGGHDIRSESLLEGAQEIARDTGTLRLDILAAVKDGIEAAEAEIRPGVVHNCGEAIVGLVPGVMGLGQGCSLRDMISRLRADLDDFRTRHGLDHVVMVNLASTEPLVDLLPEHETLQGLESLFDANRGESVRASTLYAYAALDLGFSLINFTPSNGCLLPGLLELGEKRHALCMGSDGKTGETLVKSALAPMFKYRNLRVLSWQGYNILGDRDGRILSNASNKAAKVSTKDSLLPQILGYPLHTHVGIDFVPSLSDFKTAWDFIHFQGFLDQKMSLQFTWQGNDSILAAPLVLDMVRFTDFARRQGETGLMIQLACFFKSPLGVAAHDLHTQWHGLVDYVALHRAKVGAGGSKR
jgi:myo-inositol-1-phosphate synthase